MITQKIEIQDDELWRWIIISHRHNSGGFFAANANNFINTITITPTEDVGTPSML